VGVCVCVAGGAAGTIWAPFPICYVPPPPLSPGTHSVAMLKVVEGVTAGSWHRLSLQVVQATSSAEGPGAVATAHVDGGPGAVATANVDGVPVCTKVRTTGQGVQGWVGIGATGFGGVRYDNFAMHTIE
jgi:hypothetical protein